MRFNNLNIEKVFVEDKQFKGINFADEPLAKGDYEYCKFVNCNFSFVNLFEFSFLECEFEYCDFSNAKLASTSLRDVRFKECKLLGLHFEECNKITFSVGFDSCQLNLASFYKMSLKNTGFKSCSLKEVDFSGADLSAMKFEECDLQGAVFEYSNLEKADFRTASNYSIDPENNQIKKAKFSMSGITGLLDKYDIEIKN